MLRGPDFTRNVWQRANPDDAATVASLLKDPKAAGLAQPYVHKWQKCVGTHAAAALLSELEPLRTLRSPVILQRCFSDSRGRQSMCDVLVCEDGLPREQETPSAGGRLGRGRNLVEATERAVAISVETLAPTGFHHLRGGHG